MKKIIPFLMLSVMIPGTGCGNVPADRYTVTGHIGGIADSTMILLKNKESKEWNRADTAYTRGGKFEFSGSIDNPASAVINIENPGGVGHAIEFILENADIVISAPALDSIPPSWSTGSKGKLLEKCVSIKGGRAQAEYQEYCDALFPYDVAAREAHYRLYWSDEKESHTPEDEASLKSAYDKASSELTAARYRFADEHPHYNISQKIIAERLNEPFSFTDEQLDRILADTEGSPWNERRDTLVKLVERYRNVVAMSPYSDIKLLDQKGDTVMLADYVGKGNYVFIDFWASWCGPCRAAIPHVKELHEKYNDGLTILSVSLDQAKEAWERAMREENMTWTQLWAPGEVGTAASGAYRFHAIPALVIITPDGSVALETSNPNVVSAYLETKFTKSPSNQ